MWRDGGYRAVRFAHPKYVDRPVLSTTEAGLRQAQREHTHLVAFGPDAAATSNRRGLLSSRLMTTAPAGADSVHDRPTATELLEIIAETLSDTVLAATAPHAQHQVRVAANLCRIVAREVEASDTASAEHREIDLDSADAHALVKALVRAKLAVAKPGYDAHDAAAEEALIVR